MLLADMPAGPLDLVICESCHKVMLGHRAATHAVTCRARQQLLLRAGDALRLPARDTKRTRTGPFGRGGLRASPPAPSPYVEDDDSDLEGAGSGEQPGSPPLVPPRQARRRRSLTPQRPRQFSVEPEQDPGKGKRGAVKPGAARAGPSATPLPPVGFASLAALASDPNLSGRVARGKAAAGSAAAPGAAPELANAAPAGAPAPLATGPVPQTVGQAALQAAPAGGHPLPWTGHVTSDPPPNPFVPGLAPGVPPLMALTPVQRQQLILQHQLALLRQQQQRQQQLGLPAPSLTPEQALRLRQILLLQQHAAALRQREAAGAAQGAAAAEQGGPNGQLGAPVGGLARAWRRPCNRAPARPRRPLPLLGGLPTQQQHLLHFVQQQHLQRLLSQGAAAAANSAPGAAAQGLQAPGASQALAHPSPAPGAAPQLGGQHLVGQAPPEPAADARAPGNPLLYGHPALRASLQPPGSQQPQSWFVPGLGLSQPPAGPHQLLRGHSGAAGRDAPLIFIPDGNANGAGR
ncbi:hypothetical protein QBZ16_000524 [Prototheca wickerhamii]|uniref:Uncharacterized protein n=1 Tax=Prototheca wickerhamii TaxID=3111 RepID=A0AAD9MM55_PROWI|nr:hypothetical protein QBZ16_000524 [Prototheca wickerhamii]